MSIRKIYENMVNRRQDYLPYLFYKNASDFPGLKVEEFSFNSFSNTKLQGFCYYYPENNKTLIFTHGMGAGHKAYLNEIELFCKQGYKVYAFDIKGCGDSEGESISSMLESLADLDAFLTYYKTFSQEKVVLVGHSWGGFASLNVLPYHEDIILKAVIISGFVSLKKLINSYTKGLGNFIYPTVKKYEKNINPKYLDLDIVKYLNSTSIPLLFIHSKNDNMVPYKDSIKYLHKSVHNDNLQYIIFDDRKHNPYLSEKAYKYYDDVFSTYHKNHKLYSTLEKKKEYFSKVDFEKLSKDDMELFSKIFFFLNK